MSCGRYALSGTFRAFPTRLFRAGIRSCSCRSVVSARSAAGMGHSLGRVKFSQCNIQRERIHRSPDGIAASMGFLNVIRVNCKNKSRIQNLILLTFFTQAVIAYSANARYRNVAICPRVQVVSGANVVALVPLVTPCSTAQLTAPEVTSVKPASGALGLPL